MTSKVNKWLDIIQNTFFPPTCILCGNDGYDSRDLCRICFERLPRNLCCCYRCADPLPATVTLPALCGRCLSETPAFDETYAPFLHQDEIRFLVSGLKFAAQFKNARLLGELLAEHVGMTAERPDYIIPIPLHAARFRERRFNQALEIARTVSALLNIPIDYASCIRQKDTSHQTGLSARNRILNVRGAFTVAKPLTQLHIALLDDVMTTGSTANALAAALKAAGAARVDVWVCSRA